MMTHDAHTEHVHTHGPGCGHVAIEHEGHVDYVHEGHLHYPHDEHYDEHVLAITQQNPASSTPVECACDHIDCGHQRIPHADHADYLVNGELHHKRGVHCDNHGPVVTK
ncbi:MAG: hypothetical protein ACXWQR_22935 [Ktedonobacterales bacterium]